MHMRYKHALLTAGCTAISHILNYVCIATAKSTCIYQAYSDKNLTFVNIYT